MSDRSEGEDWWLASDGKWYPPEALPQQASPGESGRWWTWQKVVLVLAGVMVVLALLGSLGGTG